MIACVHNACVGGGVDMVTAADIRYCTTDAWFCVKEVNLSDTSLISSGALDMDYGYGLCGSVAGSEFQTKLASFDNQSLAKWQL